MDGVRNLSVTSRCVSTASHPRQIICTYLLPRRDLRVVVHTRHVVHAAGLGRNVRRLGDEERAGHAGALLVVLEREVAVDVVAVGADTRQRREHDAVGELDVADLDRLEQGGGVRGGHVSDLGVGVGVAGLESGGNERRGALLIQVGLNELRERSAGGGGEGDGAGGKRRTREHVRVCRVCVVGDTECALSRLSLLRRYLLV